MLESISSSLNGSRLDRISIHGGHGLIPRTRGFWLAGKRVVSELYAPKVSEAQCVTKPNRHINCLVEEQVPWI